MAVIETSVGQAIHDNRIRQRLSVDQLAGRINISASMLKKYECGACSVPQDVANRIADVLKAPAIKKRLTWERKTNVITTPVLDGIDDHPVVVLTVIEQEIAEFLEAVRAGRAVLVNKQSEAELSPEDKQRVEALLTEGIDVYAAVEVLAMVLGSCFGQDLGAQEKRFEVKCRRKGYVRDGQSDGKVVELYPKAQPTFA